MGAAPLEILIFEKITSISNNTPIGLVELTRTAFVFKIERTSSGEIGHFTDKIAATAPATNGADIEVPLLFPYFPPGIVE